MKVQLLRAFILLFTSIVYGQVGINTTNPQGVFNIDGAKDNPTTGTPTVSQQANDVVTTATGSMGIGTTTPTNKLHVKDLANPVRLEGLVSGLKTDSLITVDASTGVLRMKSLSSIGATSSSCSPNITPGTISHNQPYGCSGYDPGAFTSSAATSGVGGTVSYTWQQSTDNGVTWSAAAGTNNIQNYDPTTLTFPTKFRRAAANYCGVVYTNVVDIAIKGAASGIIANPCAVNIGGSMSLSLNLFTGASVIDWSISPSTGMSFSSTSASTTLTAGNTAVEGTYTVTATISDPTCGTSTLTKTISVIPTAVNLGTLKKSCKEILSSGLSTGNGTYWVDPDGNENLYCAEKVYCNMTDNGGGWTLILKSMNNNTDFQYNSPIWASGAVFNNTDYNITSASTTNALYTPYNSLEAKEFWVDFVTTPDLTPFTVPSAGTPIALANATVNSNIANQYLNQPFQTSGMNSTYFSPPNAYSFQAGGVGNGVNIGTPTQGKARFGMLSNNEQNEIFNTADSSIGIGIMGHNGAVGVAFASGNAFIPPGGVIFNGTYAAGFYKAILWAR